jgi:CheY-like chemotaxis protein
MKPQEAEARMASKANLGTEPDHRSDANIEPGSQRPYRILLADDVRLELEIEKTFFLRRGFEVMTAEDGIEALQLVNAEHPHIVVLDQVMPQLTGAEVCQRLKSHESTRNIPVIIVSNHDSDEIRESCRASGAHRFVPKSAGWGHLLEVVAEIFRIPVRKAARMTVLFTVQALEGAQETMGRAVDLSEGGMCLEVNRLYDVDSQLHLRFMLPGERQQVQARACVRWVKHRSEDVYAMGLEFTGIEPGDRRRLYHYLDKILFGFDGPDPGITERRADG